MPYDEDELSELLHRLTPYPPTTVTMETLRDESSAEIPIVRRGVRSGRSWGVPLLAAVAVVAVGLGIALAERNNGRGSARAGAPAVSAISMAPNSPRTLTSPTASNSAASTTTLGSPMPCSANNLTPSIAGSGSESSAPFITIALTNRGSESCTLYGYPALQLFSAGSSTALSISVQHGTYERPDAGPVEALLRAGAAAYFTIGTSTGYATTARGTTRISRVSITVGDGATAVSLSLSPGNELGATGPQGQPIPVGVTAFASGVGN